MSWLDDYKRKLISAEEAASMVKWGDTVCIGIAQATPNELCDAPPYRSRGGCKFLKKVVKCSKTGD